MNYEQIYKKSLKEEGYHGDGKFRQAIYDAINEHDYISTDIVIDTLKDVVKALQTDYKDMWR